MAWNVERFLNCVRYSPTMILPATYGGSQSFEISKIKAKEKFIDSDFVKHKNILRMWKEKQMWKNTVVGETLAVQTLAVF